MNWFLKGCVILLTIRLSSCIQVQLDDGMTTKSQFCIGESLTLVCNGNTGVYQWRVGSIITNNDLQVSPGTNTTAAMGFTATYVNMTKSRLQFVIPADFENNTVFTCRDVVNNVDVSSTTLLLHGPISISAYAILTNPLHNSTLNLHISSVTSNVCLQSINATTYCTAGMEIMRKQVATKDELNNSNFTLTFERLNLCSCSKLNYTVIGFDAMNTADIRNGEILVPQKVCCTGQPSAPRISRIKSSFRNNELIFLLTVESPLRNAECVEEYIISVISEDQLNVIQVPIDASTTTFISFSRANISEFNPCFRNYSFQVQASNSLERSTIIDGYLDFSGYTIVSGLCQEEKALRWSLLPEFSTCISKLKYSLQLSHISGFLKANSTTISLDILNISTICNVDVITITPLFDVRIHPNSTPGVMGVISKGEVCPLNTIQNIGSTAQPYNYESYIGSLIVAVIIITISVTINIIVILKAMQYKQSETNLKKTSISERTGENDKKHEKKSNRNMRNPATTQTDTSDVNLVECQAYGTVVQPISASTMRQNQPVAGVYEAI